MTRIGLVCVHMPSQVVSPVQDANTEPSLPLTPLKGPIGAVIIGFARGPFSHADPRESYELPQDCPGQWMVPRTPEVAAHGNFFP